MFTLKLNKGKNVKFTVAVDAKQAKLCFATSGETVAIMPKRRNIDGDTDRVDNEVEGSFQTSLKCVTETVLSAENIEGRDAEITSVSSITVAASVHNNDVPVRELSQNDLTCSSPTTGYSHGKILSLSKYACLNTSVNV